MKKMAEDAFILSVFVPWFLTVALQAHDVGAAAAAAVAVPLCVYRVVFSNTGSLSFKRYNPMHIMYAIVRPVAGKNGYQ